MASVQIITVSGLPGSGTSTVCSHLCTRLGWSYVNAGQIFRRLALESGLNLAEFGQRAEADGRIDRQICRQRQKGKRRKNHDGQPTQAQ